MSINILDLVELILSACGARRVGALTVSKPSGGRRLLPMRAQNWLILLTAVATGMYFGYLYGTVLVTVLATIPVTVHFNPWPTVVQYIDYTLPVAAVAGFVAVAVALMLPHIFVPPPSSPLPAGAAGAAKKNDGSGAAASFFPPAQEWPAKA